MTGPEDRPGRRARWWATRFGDGKTATLAGLLCEVEAGWKLFPLHTVKSMKRPKKD